MPDFDSSTLDRRVRIPEHVVFRSFARETVALNLESGQYHGLNPTGGRMLDVLSANPRLGDTLDVLVTEFDQPRDRIAKDLVALCDALLERRLLETDP